MGIFGLFWRMLVAGTAIFCLAAAASYGTVHYLVKTPELQAPDLLTLDLPEAIDRASSEGFPVLIDKRERTDLLEPGRVLSQRPSPGTWVKAGAQLRLTLSAKP